MKKLLVTLLIAFCSLTSFSQTMYKSYSVVAIDSNILTPRYLIGVNDNVKPDTLGIVITIKQAQKIDNDLELLTVYRSLHTDCDSTVSFLVQVVDDYKKLNVLAIAKFKAYEISEINLKNQIDNLKQQIDIKKEQIIVKDGIIKDKDAIIDINKLQITRLKRQVTGISIGGVLITGTLLYLLFTK
jgi:hypothetical protein